MARSGEDALRVARAEKPDLVLLDIVMPGIDGFETCRQLKADPATQGAAIIFMSSLSETNSKVQGLEAGAVDYITKPFEPPEVIARVHTHLTIQELQRNLAEKNAALDRANQFIRKTFGRYVSEEVAQSVLESPEGLELGGEEREVTILMSDLRGFTALVDRLPPKEVLELLNLYLEAMVDVIGRYQATIIEILGDACLVMCGAPVLCADHADRGVACAIAMQLAMAEVNRRLASRGWPAIEMGIGIHTGRCVAGNIGSEKRSKYAAVGTTINLTSRIESCTVGGQVLITEDTRAKVVAPLRLDGGMLIHPKGLNRSLQVHVVGAIGAPFNLALPDTHIDLRPLPTPHPVRYTVMDEKRVGDTQHEGTLREISRHETLLRGAEPLPPLSNVKVLLLRPDGTALGDFDAKVLPPRAAASESALLRFTSLSPEAQSWLERQLAAENHS
jgi:class 3 adenylate cyclase/CheY-like chemotaxis protein